MNCLDCIHYDACIDAERLDDSSLITLIQHNDMTEWCDIFKNKSDFVEVVRCKDCAIPHNKWTGCPKLNGLIPPPDFYCGYGERK